MKIIALLFYIFLGLLHANEWEHTSASEIDKTEHLEWQDTNVIETKSMKWEMAQKYCQSFSIDNKDDWRLPKKSELIELARDEEGQKKFKHLQNRVFWALEEDSKDDVNAWAVYSGNGHLSSNDKCDDNAVICVRAHYEK